MTGVMFPSDGNAYFWHRYCYCYCSVWHLRIVIVAYCFGNTYLHVVDNTMHIVVLPFTKHEAICKADQGHPLSMVPLIRALRGTRIVLHY